MHPPRPGMDDAIRYACARPSAQSRTPIDAILQVHPNTKRRRDTDASPTPRPATKFLEVTARTHHNTKKRPSRAPKRTVFQYSTYVPAGAGRGGGGWLKPSGRTVTTAATTRYPRCQQLGTKYLTGSQHHPSGKEMSGS